MLPVALENKVSCLTAVSCNCGRPHRIKGSNTFWGWRGTGYAFQMRNEAKTQTIVVCTAAFPRVTQGADHEFIRHPLIFRCVSRPEFMAVFHKMSIAFPCVAKWHCRAFYTTPCRGEHVLPRLTSRDTNAASSQWNDRSSSGPLALRLPRR